MSSPFVSDQWHRSVADVVAATDFPALATALDAVIEQAVEHEGTCLLAFHRNAPPEVLHHTIDAAGARHYLDRYIAGPYLLDPLYLLALDTEQPQVVRFRDQMPDRFRSTQYYKQYCDQTHLLDEMDFVLPIDPDTTVALVVGRRRRRFNRHEVKRLRTVAPLLQAAMQRAWEYSEATPRSAQGGDFHLRLTRCFDDFGSDQLTDREREIVQLILRGHSVKSAARRLGIAPGTVMVHKRNLFNKLGISSQLELYSRFIDALAGG